MSIKTFKPTTPSRRQMTVSGFDGIDKKAKPEPSLTESLKKSSGRNIPGCEVTFANLINVYDVLNAKKLVVDQEALRKIEEVFA